MGTGRLFVFEGFDGVGKTTLSKEVRAAFEARGIPCEWHSFPGNMPESVGSFVYELHHRADDGALVVAEAALQAMHVAAHADAIHSRIMPALRSGKHVVLDRYWWSTWAYGIARGVSRDSLSHLIRFERSCWGTVKPFRVFFLSRAHDGVISPVARATIDAYERLVARESRRYQVTRLENSGALRATADRIAAELIAALPRRGRPPRARRGAQAELSLGAPRATAAPSVLVRKAPPRFSPVYDTYWRFATERQDVFFRRICGHSPPWSDDPVLREHKFTNAYRASDRVSQYLIRNVIYSGDLSPQETFFRTILFKLFNRIETWEYLLRTFGTVAYSEFSMDRYDRALTRAIDSGMRIYSAAYIMPTGGAAGRGTRKHRMHLDLLHKMMQGDAPLRVANAPSMAKVFELLREYPTIGDFLAYQYATDLNYGPITNFSEMDFVVPGPGARDGIRKCFSDLGGFTEEDAIRFVAEAQEHEFRTRGLPFRSLWGRPLQLIDCQNLFCEISKYARVVHPEVKGASGRTRIKQKFRPSRDRLRVWYPPKWGLNEQVEHGVCDVPGLRRDICR